MKTEVRQHVFRVAGLATLLLMGFLPQVCRADLAADTTVYYSGSGKRVHVNGCGRLTTNPEERAKMQTMTLAEAEAKGLPPCSRCPGSQLNQQRQAEAGAKQAVEYDPNAKVYCDALWFRVHAEDCPELILKEKKKTMTLAEADQAGARIGESGQSGRTVCCFPGYRRTYPEKTFTDDTILCGSDRKDRYKHVAGCHRYWPDRSHMRRPMKEWVADGFKVCPHCIERGPSLATISDEEWNRLGPSYTFVAPEGWVPKPYTPDKSLSEKELESLIQETLSGGNGIQELQFTNPLATVENFMCMRFFFPVGQWLSLYMAYRGTGDQRILDAFLESARHYHKLSIEYPSAARKKASDPEGLAYMWSMAACARITLQLVRKYPDKVSQQGIEEAERFLKTMVSVLKPVCEANDSLDPEMGIPRELADDFRRRAFNRSFNGIATLGMITAALEDLQEVTTTKAYQPTIDRYRKVVREYVQNWFHEGHFCEFDGQNHFYYPYSAGKIGTANGCPIFKRPEDGGHYSHTMQGLAVLYESIPEVGVDDDFLTAVANTVYHNSTVKVRKHGKSQLSGHLQCPNQYTKRPYGKKQGERHTYSAARERFYVLQAFRDDMIDGLCDSLSEQKKTAINSDHDHRIATLYAHYVKALRQDRRLIHLGEKK